MMTAVVVDLDLNRSPPRPPSPEAVAREELRQAMLRQERDFRDQVRDLHRLYWTQRNLMDEVLWKQSDGVLCTRHSSHESLMMELDAVENRHVLGDSDELGKRPAWDFDLDVVAGDGGGDDDDEFVEESLEVKGSIWTNPHAGVREQCGYRNVIDLEKPAAVDEEMEIASSSVLSNHANRNGRFWDDSRCVSLENCSPPMHDQLCAEHTACRGSSSSIGSSDTPDSRSPVKPKSAASAHMLIDLNVAQEDDFGVFPYPSQVFQKEHESVSCRPGDLWNKSGKIFPKEYESDIGSSKGSSITVLAAISGPDSSREVIAAGLVQDPQSQNLFCLQASEHNSEVRENIQHQQLVDNKFCGSSSQGSREISPRIISISSCRANDSSLDLHKPGDNLVASQPHSVMRSECREETLTVICDHNGEGIDLNASVGSTKLTSTTASNSRQKQAHSDGSEETTPSHSFAKNGSEQGNPFEECAIVEDHEMEEKEDFKKALLPISVNTETYKVQSPDSGNAAAKPVFIPETPEGHDYACLRLRASDADTVHMHPVEQAETDGTVTIAAETLLSIFSDNSACIADTLGNNSQAEEQDGSDEPQLPLDSYEESILNLEEIRDDGLSVPVKPPDKDGPSCGIKLRRGRGLRDFQREILPGLVSLARHEICDDLHAIGYELRKTRSRRTCGDKWPAPTRTRQPRRCSTAWNR